MVPALIQLRVWWVDVVRFKEESQTYIQRTCEVFSNLNKLILEIKP